MNDLNKLKSQLESMNKEVLFQTTNIGVRDKSWEDMQSNFTTIVNSNSCKNDRVRLDCGGKKFTTTKQTLLSAKKSLFEAIVNDPDFDLNQEIFFDRNPEYFGAILEYIRSGNINYKLFKKDEKKRLLEEARYYQITDIATYLEERTKEIDFVSFEFSGPYTYKGQIAGSNLLDDIRNPDLTVGAICAITPGVITFKLNSDWEFAEIQVGGYKGNTTLWYPENGSGAQISTSEDGKEWKKVGKIPSGYGKETKTVKLTKSTARYIKFNHTTYLGISYLKITKIETD